MVLRVRMALSSVVRRVRVAPPLRFFPLFPLHLFPLSKRCLARDKRRDLSGGCADGLWVAPACFLATLFGDAPGRENLCSTSNVRP